MAKLLKIKEPGYICDLFFLFFLKFNMDNCLSECFSDIRQYEIIEFNAKTLKEFEPFPEDLFVFFYAIENDKAFIPTCYLNPYKNVLTTSYSFKFLLDELRDEKKLLINLLQFYFSDLSKNVIDEFLSSKEKLFEFIKNSEYSDVIKLKLYEFFINPPPIIEKLLLELSIKENLLSRYYEKHKKLINNLQNNLDIDKLYSSIKNSKTKNHGNDQIQTIYASVCLINKNSFNCFYFNDSVVVVLGTDYLNTIEHSDDKNIMPELDSFGSAISEKNRIKILDILQNGAELTVKEIERELDITASTAHFHLTMMTRIHMIKTKNKGRTICYSLNREYFDAVANAISVYASHA